MSPVTAGPPSSPATSGCCGRGCGTPGSSGTRTARRRWRAACRPWTRWSSMPSWARSDSGWNGWWHWRGRWCRMCRGADRALAERAALLAKTDLVTGMVGEFPELQGIMGGHYARAQGEPAAVADAIRDHYAPKGPDDACPTAPESVVVALADKLDTLAGFFGARIKPTGSKDPFALAARRAGRHPAGAGERLAAAAAGSRDGGTWRLWRRVAGAGRRRGHRAGRVPGRPSQGSPARPRRAARRGHRRLRRRRRGRSRPPDRPRGGAAGVPRQRGRAQPR